MLGTSDDFQRSVGGTRNFDISPTLGMQDPREKNDYQRLVGGIANPNMSIKLGIHLRQRQAVVRCGNLSSASVDGAMNRATCLRGCHDTSHLLLVDQSEVSLRNSSPYAQYGCNKPRLAETEKHSVVRSMAC